MDEAALERRLMVGSQKARDYVQPDYGRVHHELRRKGMTLMLLWEEHRADYADSQTYAYLQFYDNYRRFARPGALNAKTPSIQLCIIGRGPVASNRNNLLKMPASTAVVKRRHAGLEHSTKVLGER
jgi:hypothetical protein